MPDGLPDLRLERPWRGRRRRPVSRLSPAAWASAALHLFALLALVLLHRVPAVPLPPPEPSFDVVFQGDKAPVKGAPKPGKFMAIPEGETSPQPVPTPPRTSPPPSPAAPPEVNLLPPEYAQEFEPPPPQAQAEPVPHPAPRNARRPAQKQTARNNPFAHPMMLSFAPAPPMAYRGLRHSKSLDLSMGPVIAGGRIQDAVAHVSSPGASADYIEGISEYVETHKFYPQQAADNGDEGTSVLEVTISRDGRVRNVRLVASAGSRWLDMGWESLFRGHQFAPFPDDMKEKERTFTLSMDYQIIYKR